MTAERILVTALGDSITAGTPLWDPDPAVRARMGPILDERSQWTYWAAAKDTRLEFRNCGINKQETSEIAARLDESVADTDVLVVQGGVNDLIHGKSTSRAAENIEQMVVRGKSLDLGVSVAELIPNNNFPEVDKAIRELNERIREIGAAEGVPILPFYATLADPERPQRMHPVWTDDGNHPSVVGHRRLGELALRLPV